MSHATFFKSTEVQAISATGTPGTLSATQVAFRNVAIMIIVPEDLGNPPACTLMYYEQVVGPQVAAIPARHEFFEPYPEIKTCNYSPLRADRPNLEAPNAPIKTARAPKYGPIRSCVRRNLIGEFSAVSKDRALESYRAEEKMRQTMLPSEDLSDNEKPYAWMNGNEKRKHTTLRSKAYKRNIDTAKIHATNEQIARDSDTRLVASFPPIKVKVFQPRSAARRRKRSDKTANRNSRKGKVQRISIYESLEDLHFDPIYSDEEILDPPIGPTDSKFEVTIEDYESDSDDPRNKVYNADAVELDLSSLSITPPPEPYETLAKLAALIGFLNFGRPKCTCIMCSLDALMLLMLLMSIFSPDDESQ